MGARLPRIPIVIIGLALVMTACQSLGQDARLPTVFNLGGTQTEIVATTVIQTEVAAAEATSNAPTPIPTRSGPTLPPTFTATVPLTLTPTDPASAPTVTPVGYHPDGHIYYIFNGDSIASLAADGTSEELILLGGPFTDLTASPDGELLAFVAPGAGSGREVFVASRDGTYLQQISCLGFPEVDGPVWRPDGEALAFTAAPSLGGPRTIYIAGVAGSNDCPAGNNQRVLVQLSSTIVDDLAWDSTGDRIFFSNGPVFGADVSGGNPVSIQTLTGMTRPTGFGPDHALIHHPSENRLFYLRSVRDIETGLVGGTLHEIPTDSLDEQPFSTPVGEFFAQHLVWSRDGRYLIIGTGNAIVVFNPEFRSAVELLHGLTYEPRPVLSPDSEQVAYINGGEDNPAVAQIFVVSRLGGEPEQITFHEEGVIRDMVWIEG